MVELNFREQAKIAELTEAVYNRANDGAVNKANFSEGIKDDYIIAVADNAGGDVVYTFVDRETGQLYVIARGTDSLQDVVDEYPYLATGSVSNLATKIAAAAEELSAANGGAKVTAAGHSLGGSESVAASLLAPDVIEKAVNVQGPQSIEKWYIPFAPTELGLLEFKNWVFGQSVPSFQITGSDPDLTQFGIQIIGSDGSTVIPTDANSHSAALVDGIYNYRSYRNQDSDLNGLDQFSEENPLNPIYSSTVRGSKDILDTSLGYISETYVTSAEVFQEVYAQSDDYNNL